MPQDGIGQRVSRSVERAFSAPNPIQKSISFWSGLALGAFEIATDYQLYPHNKWIDAAKAFCIFLITGKAVQRSLR